MTETIADEQLLDLDADLENADWLKMAWDLPEPLELYEKRLRTQGLTEAQIAALPVIKWARMSKRE